MPVVKQTLIIGLGTALALWLVAPAADAGSKKPLQFKIRAFAEAIDDAATEAGFRTDRGSGCRLALTSYIASTGERLEVTSAYFETADEANRYLQWNLERAAKVTEQGKYTDVNGKGVGRRAVVLLKKNAWQVMWTGGSTSRSLNGPNLQILLEFENQYTAL